MMNETQMIATLRTEAEKNPVVNDTLHAFALRERARHIVTLTGLANRMRKEGFTHMKEEYSTVLRLLAKLGVGKLDLDAKGRVRSLKDVRTTLQSIGLAATGGADALKANKQRNRFGKVAVKKTVTVGGKAVLHVQAKPSRPATPAHTASAIDPTKKPRVQPRPEGAEWVVLAVPMGDGQLFKSHVPFGLTKADAKRIGQAFLDLAKN